MKSPPLLWLHGGGEGGTDPIIPLVGNKVTNYASDEIQHYFGGAYILVPQCPTRWMDAGNGNTTRGETNDIYNEALMELIRNYVAKNPGIDTDRIYVSGLFQRRLHGCQTTCCYTLIILLPALSAPVLIARQTLQMSRSPVLKTFPSGSYTLPTTEQLYPM